MRFRGDPILKCMTFGATPGLTLLTDAFGPTRPFTAEAAAALGVSRKTDRQLRDEGRLAQPHHGIRTLAEPVDLVDRARAAGLLLPPGSAIGRRTAAELMDVDPRLPSERGHRLDVECLVPTGTTPRRRSGIRCYETDLPSSELSQQEGFAMTTPERTLADLLRWLPPHMGLAVADLMARRDVVDLPAVESILARWGGRRHVAQARRLLAHVEQKTESYGESWLRLRILDAGFPRPEVQIPIMENGREVYRLDLGWPALRVAVEYDGEEFHTRAEHQIHDEERRERLFVRHGWHVIGVGKAYVLGPSLRLELGIGELVGMAPRLTTRTW